MKTPARFTCVPTGSSGTGSFAAYAAAATPSSSLLHYDEGVRSIANAAIVKTRYNSTAKELDILNRAGQAHLVVDVLGYYYARTEPGAPPSSPAYGYTPVVPCRILDTRKSGGQLAPGETREIMVHGDVASQGGNTSGCGAPLGEPGAAHINVTVPKVGVGYVVASVAGESQPIASIVNYDALSQNIANAATVRTARAGSAPDLAITNHGGDAHLVIDVLGYFAPIAAPVHDKLRVGAFNILNFDYRKPDRNAPFIDQDQHLKTVFTGIDADVLLIQEQASDKAAWYQFITSLGGTYLADVMHTAWICGLGYTCTAVVSKYEIVDTFEYHGSPTPFSHHNTRVDIDVNGTLVTLYSVHFHHADAQRRVLEAQYLRDLVSKLRLEHPNRPIIFGGDFNSMINANPQWHSPGSGDFEVPIQILTQQTELDVVHVFDSSGRARTLNEKAKPPVGWSALDLQIDFLLMTSELHSHAKSPAGEYQGAIYDGPGKDGSDHLAQYVDISMAAFAK